MCRSGRGDGAHARRCPCRDDPRRRALEVARQRASRYARWCDAATDAGDTAAADRYSALLERAVEDLDQRNGHPPVELPPLPPTRAAEFTSARTEDWTDEQLEQAVQECLEDQPALDALERIIDARQFVEQLAQQYVADQHAYAAWDDLTHTEAWASPTALTSPATRPSARLTADQQLRAEYESYLDTQWLRAEGDCNGQLLTPKARAAGIDPRSLFMGPLPRALKHSSVELQSWWGRHGRLSLAAYRHQALGRASDSGAAERQRRETFDHAPAW